VLGIVPAAGWRKVRVDRGPQHRQDPAGAALDLGAVAKAFAADRIAARVRATTGSSVLVSLGGDVSVAGAPRGRLAGARRRRPRRARPVGPDRRYRDGGLATSSITVRRWRAGGEPRHHIVDPQTGRPADAYWRTVSVAAASCADANAAATAAVVRGEPALAWLEELGLAARLVRVDGSVCTTSRWPS
jgi:thiamine biosynthesis lipoprotein